jgi:DNA-binding beta-propeller fold protein YncE
VHTVFRCWSQVAFIGLVLLPAGAPTSAQVAAAAAGSRVYVVNDGDVSVIDPADN